jgi:hypothetical protein
MDVSVPPTCEMRSQRSNPPLGLFLSVRRCHEVMTADEFHQRAMEAKALAVETQDLWERELLFKIAGQWQLLSAHRAAKKQRTVPTLVVVGKSNADSGNR